jgi:DNA-binding LacI/PurR family transcriptional regulator
MAGNFKYELIAEKLREAILAGRYKAGDRLPSAKELADEYETSPITANKALNVLAEQGVLKRATGAGSVVRDPAETAGSRQSCLIGVIVFDISHPFWAGTIRGIEDVCSRHGYNLLVGNDEGNFKKAETYIRSFLARGVKGLIVVPIGHKDKNLYEQENRSLLRIIEQARVPYVLLHRKIDSYIASVAQIENYRSSYEAARLLVKLGVAAPVCMSQYYSPVVSERENGFLDALRDAGISDAESRVHRLHPATQTVSSKDLPEETEILRRIPQCDGILAVSGDILAVALQAIRLSGSWDKLKIVSFDYNRALFRHKLIAAMLETPAVEMGQQSSELLFRQILRSHACDVRIELCPVLHVKREFAGAMDARGYLVEEKVVFHDEAETAAHSGA